MTDYEAIQQLFARYAHAADDGRMDELAALYTTDGVMDLAGNRVETRDKIQEFLISNRVAGSAEGPRRTRHICLESDIVVDGSSAQATSDLIALVLGEDGWSIRGVGRYEDVLTKQDGKWLLKQRTVIIDNAHGND